MIDFLRGKLVFRDEDGIVLDVNGVGYHVLCANPYAIGKSNRSGQAGSSQSLDIRVETGADEVTIFTHYHVREDAHLLFGFSSREEQSLFRLLIAVNGIGPKVAIGILAGGKPETIANAIVQGQTKILTSLPGIGAKTAQRMIIELKDKLDAWLVQSASWAGLAGSQSSLSGASLLHYEGDGTVEEAAATAWSEAREGLLALGYKEVELDKAHMRMQPKLKGDESAEALVKLALTVLFQQG